MITIVRNGISHELEVDVLEELQPFDWSRGRVRVEEFTACSPFRDESSPSFSINLISGQWIDFGSSDHYSKGNLVTLLSYLHNDTPTEVETYLLEKYGIDFMDTDSLELNFNLSLEDQVEKKIITLEDYKQYSYRHNYLNGRGINEKVQRAFKIGYDKKGKAIAIPWFDKDGNIINVKFRSVSTKRFYYFPTGQAIKNHLYGMHFVFKLNLKRVFIVESEIDALYLWSCGFPAIALGGSNISAAQQQLILRSPITDLVIATDNDAVGRQIRERIISNFVGYTELHDLNLPPNVKDVNELSPTRLTALAKNTNEVNIKII
ncbi:toprim domain-containing protein [Priestia megaterium]|uniref:toprim domain-containing protein n=1 Tax=Priestia megaterium TaxID=1404 RepID=UPI00285FA1A3|nr:toprim domain-containing protein [Priestia megaterium]MDR7207617.1 DNA primase [Priestia megaterium]